jgi:putative transcriptional regulator
MIGHHPSGDLLASYAAGAVGAGAALVIGAHVDACAVCRKEVSLLGALGGFLLVRSEPPALSEGALERMLKRLDREEIAPARKSSSLPDFLARFNVPKRLSGHEIGNKTWLAPGIWFAPIKAEPDADARTYFIYGAKGKMLPRHTHPGQELTVVLKGAYTDDLGHFARGDFAQADESVSHAQQVTGDDECLCLIHSDGPMRPDGLVARMVQSFAGQRY